MCYVSCVTCQVLPVMCHLSHVTCNFLRAVFGLFLPKTEEKNTEKYQYELFLKKHYKILYVDKGWVGDGGGLAMWTIFNIFLILF